MGNSKTGVAVVFFLTAIITVLLSHKVNRQKPGLFLFRMAVSWHGFNLLYFQNRGLPDGSGPLLHRNFTSPHADGPFSLPATVLSRSDCD
jgi:hypothetical protein